jgi:hypothetical protein
MDQQNVCSMPQMVVSMPKFFSITILIFEVMHSKKHRPTKQWYRQPHTEGLEGKGTAKKPSKKHRPTKQWYRQPHTEGLEGKGTAKKPWAGKRNNGEQSANLVFTGVNNGSISLLENTTNRAEIEKDHQEQLEKVGKVPSLKVEMSLLCTMLIKHFGRRKNLLQQGQNLISIVICVSRYLRT